MKESGIWVGKQAEHFPIRIWMVNKCTFIGELTGSKQHLILPTFVAPTAVMLKNPCSHSPE